MQVFVSRGSPCSTEWLEWFHKNRETRWLDFKEKYYKELTENYKNDEEVRKALDKIVKQYKKTKVLTILFSSKDEKKNNARVLGSFIKRLA